jgi:hypothetical protein
MAVKLALLKSGENVIADIMELVDENEKVVSLVFTNPYVVRLLTPELLMENSLGVQLEEEIEHKVSFSPWIVLSQDKKIAVNPEWIVSVVNPHEWIKSSYEDRMNATVEGVEGEKTEDLIENFEVITEENDGE